MQLGSFCCNSHCQCSGYSRVCFSCRRGAKPDPKLTMPEASSQELASGADCKRARAVTPTQQRHLHSINSVMSLQYSLLCQRNLKCGHCDDTCLPRGLLTLPSSCTTCSLPSTAFNPSNCCCSDLWAAISLATNSSASLSSEEAGYSYSHHFLLTHASRCMNDMPWTKALA